MAHAAIGLGTLSGGWRIVHTMGSRITKLTTDGRIRRGNGRRVHAFRRGAFRHPGIDDAHHHRRDRRRRLAAPAALGALECRGKNCLGLDSDDPGFCGNRNVELVDDRFRAKDFRLVNQFS